MGLYNAPQIPNKERCESGLRKILLSLPINERKFERLCNIPAGNLNKFLLGKRGLTYVQLITIGQQLDKLRLKLHYIESEMGI